MDVRSFLQGSPPFDALDEDVLDRVVTATEIEFVPEGDVLFRQGGGPVDAVYVIRTGALELLDATRVIDLLGPGEMVGHPSAVAEADPLLSVRAAEDSLCYRIGVEEIRPVFATRPGLAFLSQSLRRRVDRTLTGIEAERADPWRADVGRLVRREPVTTLGSTSVRDAARAMSAERVSSLLIVEEERVGILTDRDLRERVLAAGMDPATPVARVMTSPAHTVATAAPAAEALARMLELGVHHLPVTDERNRVIGVVTDTDLMGLERRSPFRVRTEIERAPDRASVVAAVRGFPDSVADLVDARVDPIDIGHSVGSMLDAATERLLELAIADEGDPSVPWAWLALGSEARHEQALATDQDHALAYEASSDPAGSRQVSPVDGLLGAIAEAVTRDLEAAGIPRCRAGVGAWDPAWRHPADEWSTVFGSWIADTSSDGAVLADIAFDYRRVAGSLPIEDRLDRIVARAPAHPSFLGRMAQQACAAKPPTGFLRNLVVEHEGAHAGTLNVKRGGIMPITAIARTLAIASGFSGRPRTLDRLRAAEQAGSLEPRDRIGLEEAFRLLWQIRLEHQVRRWREGGVPDDHVDPQELGPLTRQALKESFRMIDRVQKQMAVEFGLPPR